jgi:hypothetical protein
MALEDKREGERPVAFGASIVNVVGDYIEINRVNHEDPNGRRPLFTTEKAKTSGIRLKICIATQPCRFGECPHVR